MKIICGAFSLCLMLTVSFWSVEAGVKNPDTFVLATYGTLRTLDPAVCYDDSGSQRIWNIYETLVFFDGSSTDGSGSSRFILKADGHKTVRQNLSCHTDILRNRI